MKKLLSDGKGNTKIAKNTMKTLYLALRPHKLNSSGEDLCKFSTKECRAMCLNSSGMGGFDNVQKARLAKTDYFVSDRKTFLYQLWSELEKANKKGNIAIRLNTISDVDWEKEFQSIEKSLGMLNNIQFYDYTKDPFKVDENKLTNYHFTFSFSGGNWKWCEKFLTEKKANIAVVFKSFVPSEWKGFKVIDGTEDDERFGDEKGVIVGLKYKVPRGVKYEHNKFVIDN